MASLFEDSLRRIKLIFKLSGTHFEGKRSKTIFDVVKYRWLYIISFLWLNTEMIAEIAWIIDGANNGKKLKELTYVWLCAANCILANTKTDFLLLNEDKLTQVTKNLQDLDKDVKDSENYKQNTNIKQQRRFLNVVISMFIYSMFLNIIGLSLTPLVLMAVEVMKTNEIELMLPIPVIYPIDVYDIKYWPFVYLHQIWSRATKINQILFIYKLICVGKTFLSVQTQVEYKCFKMEWCDVFRWLSSSSSHFIRSLFSSTITVLIVMSKIGGTDSLFYYYCTVIRAHFETLKHDFESINTRNETEFQEKFQKLVARHQLLIRSVNLVDAAFTKSILWNFMSSSLTICLAGFNVTATDDFAIMLSFLLYLVPCMLQVFLLCYFGDMVMTASMEVSNGIFNSKWYFLTAKTAQQVLLVQIRAQEPVKMTAYKFADVTLTSFLSIMSTAWSYFALLNTINDG